jgi:hypothetical protein
MEKSFEALTGLARSIYVKRDRVQERVCAEESLAQAGRVISSAEAGFFYFKNAQLGRCVSAKGGETALVV